MQPMAERRSLLSDETKTAPEGLDTLQGSTPRELELVTSGVDQRSIRKIAAVGLSLVVLSMVAIGLRLVQDAAGAHQKAEVGAAVVASEEQTWTSSLRGMVDAEHPIVDDSDGPHDNRAIAKAEQDLANDHCAANGESCLESKCCQEAGMQCFTKDGWWAQCMEECIPGPNVLDQASSAAWECKALGDRTAGEPKECSATGVDCSDTECCSEGGTQCFMKNEFWATCRPSCTPGPDLFSKNSKPWSCETLGPRATGAAPWVETECAHAGEDCREKGCCADSNHQCFKQNDFYATCKPTCEKGEKLHPWDPAWSCEAIGPRTPVLAESGEEVKGKVQLWVADECVDEGENCLDSKCCKAVGAQCYSKNEFWGTCQYECSTKPNPIDNVTWDCEAMGPKSIGLSIKGYPSLYCITLFMPTSYEGDLLRAHIKENAGIFQCDGYDVFAAEEASLGVSKDDIEVKAILIPKISVGVSQDGTAGNAKLFMAVWDKVIAGGRFRNYDWTIKVDPDAVLVPWRIRDHMGPHVGEKVYVVNCNKFPGSPNFPMMYGAVEVFSSAAMIAYAETSWKCGKQLPWGSWGEDYYMTHCMDFVGVGRISDFGILGDNMCTGANCADVGVSSFHPFKTEASWMECWTKATAKPAAAPVPAR